MIARRVLASLLAVTLLLSAAPATAGERKDAPPASSNTASEGWVVGLAEPLDVSSRRALKGAGVQVSKVSDDRTRVLVTAETQSSSLADLRRTKGVAWAEPVQRLRASRVPSDPAYARQWGLPAVGAPTAWDLTQGAPSVVIAVIDTGVDLVNVEFAGRLVAGRDFVNGDSSAQDDEGHGTHVASIAAASADNSVGGSGLAPLCRIMPVKVLDSEGSGTNFDVAEGIRWAADRGARVINLSLGSRQYSQAIAEAVQYALRKDVVVVAAAGNDATSVDYPARLPGVIAVSAVDSNMRLASFSNRGAEIDIAAPGVDILATLPGGRMEAWQGTSMASPFVAAAAALVRSSNPQLTQAQTAARLTSSARDIGPVGQDSSFGAGMLNAAAAVGQATSGDDDIPGVEIPVSPFQGALSARDDTVDVFRVNLQAGQRIVASMTADSGTDFDLSLYGPSAVSIGGSVRPLAFSANPGSAEQIAFVAPSAGPYYLVAQATSGSGAFSLAYTLSAPLPSDDDVPGVVLPPSPVVGTLDENGDTDDVFRVTLGRGDRLQASLTGAPGTDFDLYLFPPDVPTVDGSFDPVAFSDLPTYPESLSYTATKAGDYYLNPYAYDGAGSYTLTWSITRAPGDFDDDVPGRALPPSPFGGTVSVVDDVDDVFFIDLVAGQELTVDLMAGFGSDFDLYLFGPGTTTVDGSEPSVARANSSSYPERLTYVATAAGRYYLDVYAYAGSGSYSLSYTLSAQSADNNIPGVTPGSSPLNGLLDERTDPDDVYRITLAQGQQLTARLTAPGSPEPDFDLYLFAPDATDVGVDDPVAVSYGEEYPELITYVAPVAGTYYLDVYAYEGSGAYRLEYAVGEATARATTITLEADKPVGQTAVSLAATLSAAGTRIPGAAVTFQAFVANSWRLVGFARTDSNGAATAVSDLAGARRFRVLFSGNAGHVSSTSPVTEIPNRAAAGIALTASPATTAYGGRTVLTARATDLSSGAALIGTVRIERRSGSRWIPVATTRVAPGTVRASATIRSAATYRAVFAGTESHDPAQGDSLTVKPRVVLSAPSSPSSARRSTRFAVSGSLAPRHTAGTPAVRIECSRWDGSRWVLKRTVSARVSNSGAASRYTASVSLPLSGRWKLRAVHPADAAHALTYGAYSRIITVR
ncbi:MAG: S8 family serine peptidase [Coriobacteriia bacterium]|nr:S8 family serine peptidase [Coriobacteriia bacterium]